MIDIILHQSKLVVFDFQMMMMDNAEDSHLEQHGKALETRPELKRVFLNIEECPNVGDKGMASFMESLCKNPNAKLSELHISSGHSGITVKSFAGI